MIFEIVLGIPEVLDYWNSLDKKYESSKLTGKEKILFTKLIKAFRLLETNPRSNSLSTHEITALTGKYGFKVFQSYLENNVPSAGRIFWAYGPDKSQITIKNVKSGRRKGKEFYRFPLYKELEKLLKEMKTDKNTGRLFSMYSVVPEHYTWPLSFWKRGIALLLKAKKISKAYSLKQIPSTLASFLVNSLQMDIFTVKKLLDHTDVKVTDKHYVDFRVDNVRKELDEISIENFI